MPYANTKLKLNVSITTPEAIIFNGEVESITAVNLVGKFDILPMHTNFISIIKDYIIIREPKLKEKNIKIDGGVIKVNEDKISIFLGIGIFKEGQRLLKQSLKMR